MSTSSLLLFGPGGQLGRRLIARAGDRILAVGRDQVDLEADDGALEAAIGSAPVVGVINAAAWTQVDLAESEGDRARTVNADAPRRMAESCARRGLPFIHVSTDYVFDGTKSGPWLETDPTGPLNVYGSTKLKGERAVMEAHPEALIVRTSWVVSEHGSNFIKTMLRLADKPELTIVGDQYGVATDADALAAFILQAVDRLKTEPAPERAGLVNFRNAGEPVSWAEFAQAIFDTWGGPQPAIRPISTAEYGAPAARPANSVLSIERLESQWGHVPPTWREGLERILSALRTAG